jgi:DNA-binding transcriptional LysR family regulator
MMTFKQLEALYWIVQLGGFAPAAQKLHTSQSAVSKRVHELEQVFDTPLFDRSQRTARLTEKGEEMFLLARKLLRERDLAVEQFAKPEVIERRLRIGVTELTAMTWLPRLVALVQEHYPKVKLEPDVDGSLPLRDKLLADELDLILVPDAFADTRLRSKVVGQVESAWMAKPGLVPSGTTRLHELAQVPLLVQGDSSGTGRLYDAWLREQGIETTDAIVVSNLIALTSLTLSGFGASYLPRQCMAPLVSLGMLAVIDVEPALPAVPYVALYKGEVRSTLTSALIMLAQSCCDFSRAFQTAPA